MNGCLPAATKLLAALLAAAERQGQGQGEGSKTLIYGAGEAGLRLLESLRFDLRFSIVGLLDDNPQLWGRKVQGLAIHRPDQLEGLIKKQRIRQVLLAMPSTPLSRRSQLVRQLKAMGLEVMAMPSLAQIASGGELRERAAFGGD